MRADFLAERAERGFAPAARPLEPPPPKPPISIPAPAPSNDGDTSLAAGKAVQGDALVPHEDAAAAPGSGRRTDSGDDIAAAVSSEAAGSAELCDGAQMAEPKVSLRRSTSSVRSLRRLDSTVKDSPEVRRLQCSAARQVLRVARCIVLVAARRRTLPPCARRSERQRRFAPHECDERQPRRGLAFDGVRDRACTVAHALRCMRYRRGVAARRDGRRPTVTALP